MTYNKFHQIDENTETNDHLTEIVNSIKANGWQGLPLLANGDQLYNGCHRAVACEIIGVEPEVHQIDVKIGRGENEYIDMLWEAVDCSADAGDLYRSLCDLLDEDAIDSYSVEIIKAEYDKE